MNEVVIVTAVRTPIARIRGALSETRPDDMAALVIKEAVSRARRCRKVRGKAYCGYCAAKREKFFGWRLHLIRSTDGIPVAFDLLPAAQQDLTRFITGLSLHLFTKGHKSSISGLLTLNELLQHFRAKVLQI